MRRASIQIFPKCLQTFRNRKSLFHPDRRRHFRLNNFSRRLFMIESDSTGFSFYAFSVSNATMCLNSRARWRDRNRLLFVTLFMNQTLNSLLNPNTRVSEPGSRRLSKYMSRESSKTSLGATLEFKLNGKQFCSLVFALKCVVDTREWLSVRGDRARTMKNWVRYEKKSWKAIWNRREFSAAGVNAEILCKIITIPVSIFPPDYLFIQASHLLPN